MAIREIKAPGSGAFSSLVHAGEQRVLVKLAEADAVRVPSREDSLNLAQLESGGSRRPQISADIFKKFLDTIG